MAVTLHFSPALLVSALVVLGFGLRFQLNIETIVNRDGGRWETRNITRPSTGALIHLAIEIKASRSCPVTAGVIPLNPDRSLRSLSSF